MLSLGRGIDLYFSTAVRERSLYSPSFPSSIFVPFYFVRTYLPTRSFIIALSPLLERMFRKRCSYFESCEFLRLARSYAFAFYPRSIYFRFVGNEIILWSPIFLCDRNNDEGKIYSSFILFPVRSRSLSLSLSSIAERRFCKLDERIGGYSFVREIFCQMEVYLICR